MGPKRDRRLRRQNDGSTVGTSQGRNGGAQGATCTSVAGGDGRNRGAHGFWLCHGVDGKRCGYMVPRGQAWCDACGNQPPEHVSARRVPERGGNGRPQGGGNGGGGGGGRVQPPCPTTRTGGVAHDQAARDALASAKAAHRKALEEKDREIKQLKKAATSGGEAAATGDVPLKPSAATGKERTPQQEADAKLRTEKHADIKAWTVCLQALSGRPEEAATFQAKIDAARGVLRDIETKASAARAAAAAEARDRKSPKAQLQEIEAKLARTDRKIEGDAKKLEGLQAELAQLQEKIQGVEAGLERQREEVKTLCGDRAKLHSELAASSAAAAGAAAPADDEGLAHLALGAVMGMLPQLQGLGQTKVEAAGAALMASLGQLCTEMLDAQTGMDIDDKSGDVRVFDPLEGLAEGLNKDMLRYAAHLREKAAPPPAPEPVPVPEGVNQAPAQSQEGPAGGSAAGGTEDAAAEANLALARDSGKVTQRLAGGNRAGPF